MIFIDTVYASPETPLVGSPSSEEYKMPRPELEYATQTDEGLLASLGINSTLFAFQLVNFLVVVAVIWFLILKPVTKKMSERQKLIDDSLDNAKKIQDKLTKGERDYQERIDVAKVEANKILEKASAEARSVAAELKDKSQREIEALIAQAKNNIASDREDMLVDVKEHAAELIVQSLAKVLGERLDKTTNKKFIDEILADVHYEEKK